tara:strand:- start:70 stop:516 length:447 start_codon:yes stop_codon:yes gene_type:complete
MFGKAIDVVVGDFNENDGYGALEWLKGQGYTDALAEHVRGNRETMRAHVRIPLMQHTWERHFRLDHIVYLNRAIGSSTGQNEDEVVRGKDKRKEKEELSGSVGEEGSVGKQIMIGWRCDQCCVMKGFETCASDHQPVLATLQMRFGRE